jgi:LPXTG-motif cell wall-anchored protein
MTLRRALTCGLFGLAIAAAAPMAAASAAEDYPVDETGGLTVSETVAAVGSSVTVSGDGYAPNTAVTVSASTAAQGFAPLTGGLGSFLPATAGVQRRAAAAAVVDADGSGAFSTSVTLTEIGLTTITATGENPSGGTRTLIATVEVVAAGGVGGDGDGDGDGDGASGVGGDGALPDTGASVLLPVTLGAILVLGGAGLVTVVRRRKRGDATTA